MTQLSTPKFRLLADKWMLKQGFVNRQDTLDTLLLDNKLEEEKFHPQGLYERDGDLFLTYFFNKENYFRDSKGNWVTGFDLWKFPLVEMYEIVLNLPTAIIFYNEQEKEFCFRTTLELGKPYRLWRKNKEFDKDYEQLMKLKLPYGSKEWRDKYRHIVDRLFRNTGKSKGSMVWDIRKFNFNIIKYNKRLF